MLYIIKEILLFEVTTPNKPQLQKTDFEIDLLISF